jgi:kumamolisin
MPGETLVGPADPNRTLSFSILLRVDQDAVDRYLAEVYDPASSAYRHFLGADAFGRRFGLGTEDIVLVQERLRAAGFRVADPLGQRISLDVTGTVGRLEAYFGFQMAEFRRASGGTFLAPLDQHVIPAELRGTVTGVAGVNGRARGEPRHTGLRTLPAASLGTLPGRPLFQGPPAGAAPAAGLTPEALAEAYNVTPLWDQGILGQGQSVAIISFSTFDDADVQVFDQVAGISGAPSVEHRPIDGGATETSGGGLVENALDIDVIRGVAPMAQIINYEVPAQINGQDVFAQEMGRAIQAIVDDGRATSASLSWGTCDTETLGGQSWLPREDRALVDAAVDSAVAAGISIFVASGDQGAYDCQRFLPSDQRPTVDWPDGPGMVMVGGTLLFVQEDLSYGDEAGWEDVLSQGGSGGGLNPFDPRPPWQVGPGVDNADSNGARQVPDVAGPGDPDSGYFIVSGRQAHVVGGTSGAAPFWAGSLALMAQFADQQGAGPIGYVNPPLYEIAAAGGNPLALHDVVRGGNRRFDCTPGWDYATGLGSPNVFNLAGALVAGL